MPGKIVYPIPSSSAKEDLWDGTCVLGNKLLVVSALSVPVHRTANIARPSLKVSLSL